MNIDSSIHGLMRECMMERSNATLADKILEGYQNISWKVAAPLLAAPSAYEFINYYFSSKLNHGGDQGLFSPSNVIEVGLSTLTIAATGLWAAYKDSQRKKTELIYKNLFENTNGAIYRTLPTGELLMANPALAKMLGYNSVDELKSAVDYVTRLYVNPSKREDFKTILNSQNEVQGLQIHLIKKDWSTIWVSESARAVRNERGEVEYYEGFVQDITTQKLLEKELEERSNRDSLTGLYSRDFFNWNINKILDDCTSKDINLGIIMMDLDRFKQVNDKYGHIRGDKILSSFAHQFGHVIKQDDYPIRFGGDEFLILLPNADQNTGRSLIGRLRRQLDKYNRFNNRDINYDIGFSAGYSLRRPDATEEIEFFIAEADKRMYADKERRKAER